MYQDEIIAEVWRNREAFAKRHHHNLHEIVLEIQKRQQTPLSCLVDKKHRTSGSMICREAPQS
jgi:predicted metal-dependent hydrolase